jgi:hypothetical protein
MLDADRVVIDLTASDKNPIVFFWDPDADVIMDDDDVVLHEASRNE